MEWKYVKAPLDQKAITEGIKEFEKEFSVVFPSSYTNTVKKYNGGSPENNTFKVGDTERVFRKLLSVIKTDKGSIFHVQDWLKEDLPSKVIAFGSDPGGNYVCFDFAHSGKIVFFDHETGKLEKVADSFDKFITSLSGDAKPAKEDDAPDIVDINIETRESSKELDQLLMAFEDTYAAMDNLLFIKDHFEQHGMTNANMHLLNSNDELAKALKIKIPSLEDESIEVDIPSSLDITVVQEGLGEAFDALKAKAKNILNKISESFHDYFSKWLTKAGRTLTALEQQKAAKFSGDGSQFDIEKWLNQEWKGYGLTPLFNIASVSYDCLNDIKSTTKIEDLGTNVKAFNLAAINEYLQWLGLEIVYHEASDKVRDYQIIRYELEENDKRAKRKPQVFEGTLKQHGFTFEACKKDIDTFIKSVGIVKEGNSIAKFVESAIAHNKKVAFNNPKSDPEFLRFELPTIENNIKVVVRVVKLCMDWTLGCSSDFLIVINKLK